MQRTIMDALYLILIIFVAYLLPRTIALIRRMFALIHLLQFWLKLYQVPCWRHEQLIMVTRRCDHRSLSNCRQSASAR